MDENSKFLDISVRKQLYLQGVLNYLNYEFSKTTEDLKVEVLALLALISSQKFESMSRTELSKLIINLKRAQAYVFKNYESKLFAQLALFSAEDLSLSRILWANAFLESKNQKAKIEKDEEAISFIIKHHKTNALPFALYGIEVINEITANRIFKAAVNTPMPANGLNLENFLKGFLASAQVGIENTVRKAWANKKSMPELTNDIGGASKPGFTSQIQKIKQQGNAALATSLQHLTSIIGAGVVSTFFSSYTWLSVIDNATSAICYERNKKVFKFGKGPLPPAHILCRSHIAPYVGIGDIANQSLYAWAVRQPEKVAIDLFGIEIANKIKNGTLKAKDLQEYIYANRLTQTQYNRKSTLILT